MRVMSMLMAVALLCLPLSAQALNEEAQGAKEEGMIDYNLGYVMDAIPKLEIAAEAGDVDSMYYLGESHRLTHMSMTQEALDWYLQAAEHGDPYAMLRLHSGGACVSGDYCPEDAEGWREKALAITLPKAKSEDTDAMLALYYIYGALEDDGESDEWLERAAEAGNPEAQDQLGNNIRGGHGWYFFESRRLEAAEKWFRRAAEQGYVPAMGRLSDTLIKMEKYQEAWDWMLQASAGGHVDKRLGEGWCYLDPSRGEKCLVNKDKVKGWAILSAMVEETGLRAAERVLEWNVDRLSSSEKHEAEELAQEWLNKEPPLSNFPPRYGF